MFWQNNAIHAVPSACSRYPPVGSGELRSKTPMLSRPRNPPSKTLLPVRSLRFTHHVKFSNSLWNERSSQSMSPVPFRCFSSRYVKIVDHREREHVEREVPRGVPRVLPFVGHRDDVGVQHVMPMVVARRPTRPAET